jgi:hypothetical protein
MSLITFANAHCAEETLAVDAQGLPLKKPNFDAKTQKILAQFANIVLGFLGIVQDPNNAANVKDRINDMVNNAVNIVTEAVKKGELSLDATEEDLQAFAQEIIKKKLIVID